MTLSLAKNQLPETIQRQLPIALLAPRVLRFDDDDALARPDGHVRPATVSWWASGREDARTSRKRRWIAGRHLINMLPACALRAQPSTRCLHPESSCAEMMNISPAPRWQERLAGPDESTTHANKAGARQTDHSLNDQDPPPRMDLNYRNPVTIGDVTCRWTGRPSSTKGIAMGHKTSTIGAFRTQPQVDQWHPPRCCYCSASIATAFGTVCLVLPSIHAGNGTRERAGQKCGAVADTLDRVPLPNDSVISNCSQTTAPSRDGISIMKKQTRLPCNESSTGITSG